MNDIRPYRHCVLAETGPQVCVKCGQNLALVTTQQQCPVIGYAKGRYKTMKQKTQEEITDVVEELESYNTNITYLRCISAILSANRPALLHRDIGHALDEVNKKVWEKIVVLEQGLNRLKDTI